MVFWLGILVGVIFAWYAVRTGFFETWALTFNLFISIYLALFLGPAVAKFIPAANTPYGTALMILCVFAGAFILLHGISYTFFTGQVSAQFPKAFNVLCAGVLGFIGGFLTWSFFCLLIYITPVSENSFIRELGFECRDCESNINYVSLSCNTVNAIVASPQNKSSAEQIIAQLVKQCRKPKHPLPYPPAEPNNPLEPNQPLLKGSTFSD